MLILKTLHIVSWGKSADILWKAIQSLS